MNSLDRRRQLAAQTAFEEHVFDTSTTPEDADGWTWTTPGDTWERGLYFPNVEDAGSPSVRGNFSVKFLEGTAVIEAAYASIEGNDVGHRPEVTINEWEQLDGNTWYQNLSPAFLSHAIAHENPTVSITKSHGAYWLHNGNQPGETDYQTLEEAKAAGDRLAAVSHDTLSDRMARDAGLDPDQWIFGSDVAAVWFDNAQDDQIKLTFVRSGWELTRAGEIITEQPTAPEAVAALELPPSLKFGQ